MVSDSRSQWQRNGTKGEQAIVCCGVRSTDQIKACKDYKSFAKENNIVAKLIVDESPDLTGHLSIRLFVDIFDIEIKVYKMLLYPILIQTIRYRPTFSMKIAVI